MISIIKKLILYTLLISFSFSPVFETYRIFGAKTAKAADDYGTESDDSQTSINIGNQSNFGYTPAATSEASQNYKSAISSPAYQNLAQLVKKYNSADNLLNFEGVLTFNSKNARIILNESDRKAIRALRCMAKVTPDYENDHDSLYRDISVDLKARVDQLVTDEKKQSTPKFTTFKELFIYLRDGFDRLGNKELDPEIKQKNAAVFDEFVTAAEKTYTNEKIRGVWQQMSDRIEKITDPTAPLINIETLACAIQEDVNSVRGDMLSVQGRQRIADRIDGGGDNTRGILNRLMIDLRALNMIVYLVTPKDKGGAGHWRVRVRRILQVGDLSNESEATREALNNDNSTLNQPAQNNVVCDETMTAAECGQLQNEQADAEVVDEDGTTYDAQLYAEDDAEDAYLTERNISAHYTGQAVDISEVDDIRCTLVKKRRLGGDSKQKKPIRPIKLAWQTTEGYNQSGDSTNFDLMSIMKDAASDTVSDMLASLNGDETVNYEGDLSKASLEDMIGILGQSLMGYAIDAPGFSLKGYDVGSTLKNLGGAYLADYLGLPREIFVGRDFNDFEAIKYLVGRSAIEKRLGLPFGSLDTFNLLDAKAKNTDGSLDLNDPATLVQTDKDINNLEGVLLNIGRSKIEYEMGLDENDLADLVRENTPTGDSGGGEEIDVLIGRKVIEHVLNLNSDSWPKTAVQFANIGLNISDIRKALIQQNPGYIDALLNLTAGMTQNFIDGRGEVSDSYDFAKKVGQIRMANTSAGLKYFSMNNTAYEMPGPDKDHPGIPDTWGEALKGEKSALITIGIYTLARLLAADSPNILTLDKKKTFAKLYVSEDGISDKEIEVADFGRYVMRNWLRAGLTRSKDATCSKITPDINVNVTVDDKGRTIYDDTINMSETVARERARLCILSQPVSYKIAYKKTGNPVDPATGEPIYEIVEKTETISSDTNAGTFYDNVEKIGLEPLDLYRLWGYDKADGRSVFQRIGAEILYYGLANKALGEGEQTKIDLLETNPQLHLRDGDIAFYVSRILKTTELSEKILDEWDLLKKDLQEERDITSKINSIVSNLQNIYNSSDSDISKYQKIAQSAKEIVADAEEIRQSVEALKRYYESKSTPGAVDKVNKINVIIIDINQLIRVVSEIIAGKEIKTTDTLTIEQIQIGAKAGTNNTDSGDGRRSGKTISPFVLAGLIMGILSGKISPAEMLIELGGTIAESKLGLPQNSLHYLYLNYDKKGVRGPDALFQAIGQARIEEQFNMPKYYFQGYTLKAPDFRSNAKELQNWLPEDKYPDVKGMSDAGFTIYLVKKTYLKNVWQGNALFEIMVKDATTNFWSEMRKRYGANTIIEKTLDDIVKNIGDRKLNDASRSPENDLLFRMGLPMGQYSALKNAQSGAWFAASKRAGTIDDVFDINDQSTKLLFTGESAKSASVSNKEKDLLEASNLKMGKNLTEVYLRLLNNELTPDEAELYGLDQSFDYVSSNPYAQSANATADSCPIVYTPTADQKFQINNETLEANSYCYYDKTGRHCFQSADEARAYAADHLGDMVSSISADGRKVNGITGYFAIQLALAFNASRDGDDPLMDWQDLYAGMTNFLTDSAKISVFNGTTLNVIKQVFKDTVPEGSADTVYIEKAIERIANGSATPSLYDTLIMLLTRKYSDSPMMAYKELVGQVEAQKILTYRLFDGLGLDIDPRLFDAGDFYDVLTGDLSSLFRLGANFVDRALDLSSGSTMMIYYARTAENRKCILDQVAGSFLGDLVGLNYVPIYGQKLTDFMPNLGQAKVEEALGLPRGSFRGETMSSLIDNIRPINFAIAFKIPISAWVPENMVADAISQILGEEEGKSARNADPLHQLQTLKRGLIGISALTQKQNTALAELDTNLKTIIMHVLRIFASTDSAMILDMPGPESQQFFQIYHKELNDFYDNVLYLDSLFGLDKFSTYMLLSDRMTTTEYKNKIGNLLLNRIGAQLIASQVFGLEGAEADAAINLAATLKKTFVCTGSNARVINGVCYTGSSVSQEQEPNYHNWGQLYKNLDKLFAFKLDDKLSLPEGTIQKVLDDPANAFVMLLQIGAQKLDAELGLDSSKVASATGLFEALFPGDKEFQEDIKACHLAAFGSPNYEKELEFKIESAKRNYDQCLASSDGAKDCTAEESSYTYWVTEMNTRAQQQQDCIVTKRNERANEAALKAAEKEKDDLCKYNGNIHQSATNCVAEAMNTYAGRLWEWFQEAVSEIIADKLSNLTVKQDYNCREITDSSGKKKTVCDTRDVNVGVTVPVGHIRALIFKGDVRYLYAIAMSFTMNIIMVEIDGIRTSNCNPDETYDNSCRQPVPAGFRVTYEDIYYAIFGPSYDSMNDTAVWLADSGQSANTFDEDALTHNVQGLPAGSDAGDVFLNGMAGENVTISNPNPEEDNLRRLQDGYGMPQNYDGAARLDELTNQDKAVWESCEASRPAGTSFRDCYYQRNSELYGDYTNWPITKLESYRANSESDKKQVFDKIKKFDWDRLMYKMSDIALWKLDNNIYPGFTRIMTEGSSQQKWGAIVKYFENGIRNGHILGIDFNNDAFKDIALWAKVALFAKHYIEGNKDLAFSEFVKNGGYDLLAQYIGANTEKWFGISVTPDIARGFITGICTGDWGLSAISLDSILGGGGQHTITVDGKSKTVPTLGSALVDWGVSRVFSWVDSHLGLPAGTSFKVAKMTYDLYAASKALDALRPAIREVARSMVAANIPQAIDNILSSQALRDQAIKACGLTANATNDQIRAALMKDPDKLIMATVDGAQGFAAKAYDAAKSALYAYIINMLVQKLLGKILGKLESALGLVPGSLVPVVSYAIYGLIFGFDPVSIAITIITFIAINLWGWYKIEYWCTADGYYPKIGHPNYAQNDISGLGEWGGDVTKSDLNKVLENGMIRAAQYKAKRLVGDTLVMQNSEKFRDGKGEAIYPLQIMTGRSEDVKYWANLVTPNICSRQDNDWTATYTDDQNGARVICDKDTRVGLWENPQTIKWTHIGF